MWVLRLSGAACEVGGRGSVSVLFVLCCVVCGVHTTQKEGKKGCHVQEVTG